MSKRKAKRNVPPGKQADTPFDDFPPMPVETLKDVEGVALMLLHCYRPHLEMLQAGRLVLDAYAESPETSAGRELRTRSILDAWEAAGRLPVDDLHWMQSVGPPPDESVETLESLIAADAKRLKRLLHQGEVVHKNLSSTNINLIRAARRLLPDVWERLEILPVGPPATDLDAAERDWARLVKAAGAERARQERDEKADGERLALDYTGGGIVDISCPPRPPAGAPESERLAWLVRRCKTLQACFSGPSGHYPNCEPGDARDWLAAAYSAACDWLPPATVGECEHLATFDAADRNPSAARAELARLARAAATRLLELHQGGQREAMLEPRREPQERARQIALKVDRLFWENPTHWMEQWTVAMREAEQWHAREQEARKRQQEALDAIWCEKRAVEAGTVKPRLTDEATRPGEGWRWQWVEISDPANRLRVQNLQAWMPPDATWPPADAQSPTDLIWPGRSPTLAAMYLTLAVLHDGIGEGWGKILDSTTANSGAVGFIEGKNFEDGAAHFSIGDLPAPGELRYSAQGVERLASHLNAVRADLEAAGMTKAKEATKQDAPEPEATPETDSNLIYQAVAADSYNIPKSVLSKAAKKKPSEPGYLWSGRGVKPGQKKERVWFRKDDLERIARSRKAIGRAAAPLKKMQEKHPAPVAPRVSGKKSLEENQRAFFENYSHENTKSED